MGKTRRIYNEINSFWFKMFTKFDPVTIYKPSYEDYKQSMKHKFVCMGRCSYCKDKKRDQKQRTEKSKYLILNLMD